MEGSIVVEQGSIAEVLALLFSQNCAGAAELGQAAMAGALSQVAGCSSSIRGRARGAMSLITMTSTVGSTRCF